MLVERRIVRAAHTAGFATGEEGSGLLPQLPHTASSTTGKEELLPRLLSHRRGSHSSVATTGGLPPPHRVGMAGAMSPR